MITINTKKLNLIKNVAIIGSIVMIIAEIIQIREDGFNLFLALAAALLLAIAIITIKESGQKAVECQVCHSSVTTEFCPMCGTRVAKVEEEDEDSIEVVNIDTSEDIDKDFYAAEKEYEDTDDDIAKIQKALVKNILDERAEMEDY